MIFLNLQVSDLGVNVFDAVEPEEEVGEGTEFVHHCWDLVELVILTYNGCKRSLDYSEIDEL